RSGVVCVWRWTDQCRRLRGVLRCSGRRSWGSRRRPRPRASAVWFGGQRDHRDHHNDGSCRAHRDHRVRHLVNEALTDTLISREGREKLVLVGVALGGDHLDDIESSLDELSQLVDTAGADEVARVVQRRDRPDPATYVGRGKAEELREVSLAVDSDTVVFDDELTPAQQFNLEKVLGRTAIDRTAVILDI